MPSKLWFKNGERTGPQSNRRLNRMYKQDNFVTAETFTPPSCITAGTEKQEPESELATRFSITFQYQS